MSDKKYFCETCIKTGLGMPMTQNESDIHRDIHPDHKTVSVDDTEDNGI